MATYEKVFQVTIEPSISFVPVLAVETELNAQIGCDVVTQEFQAITLCGTVSFELLDSYDWLSLQVEPGSDTATVTVAPQTNVDEGVYNLILLVT